MSLLLLLQHRGRLTAAELADELEVSVRTIYRDVEALGAAGVPVYTEPGRNGGVQLIGGYRTRLTGLTAKEAEALFAAGVPGPVGQLGLGTVLGAAQLKLLAALPKDLAERATLTQQRFHLDAPGWFKGPRNDPHLADLATAVWEDRRIVIAYRHPGREEPGTRHLDPFGLVCKAGTWYLVARRDGELRTYRVSRVAEVSLLDEHFERDPEFELAAYWSESVDLYESVVPEIEVVVDASDAALRELTWLARGGGRALVGQVPRADATTRVTMAFDHLGQAFSDLFRLGAEVEVIEPTELRDRIMQAASEVVARYRPAS